MPPQLSAERALSFWRPLAGMMCPGQAGSMSPDLATYPGYRFPAEIISHAVWLYHVFSLSLRDVELILAERGIRHNNLAMPERWIAMIWSTSIGAVPKQLQAALGRYSFDGRVPPRSRARG